MIEYEPWQPGKVLMGYLMTMCPVGSPFLEDELRQFGVRSPDTRAKLIRSASVANAAIVRMINAYGNDKGPSGPSA